MPSGICYTLYLLLPVLAFGQAHSYSKSEIEEGARNYRSSCIGCHGSEGASVSGVDLGRGKMKRVVSDEDFVNVILKGVPGTGMPATVMPQARAFMIVAYLRTLNEGTGTKSTAAADGNIARGQELFHNKGSCSNCHRVLGAGGRSGPDLSEAGMMLRPIEIEIALLDPDAGYTLGSQPTRVTYRNGSTDTGFLLNQDTATVQLLNNKGRLLSLDRNELTSVAPVKSWMPSYRGRLDSQELADLIAYIGSLKGAQ